MNDDPTKGHGIWSRYFDEHLSVIAKTEVELRQVFEKAASHIVGALANGNKLMLCGNGGSSTDAQHIAAELTVRFIGDRRALPAFALGTDSASMTACGNDFGFDRVFARQVEALGRAGDVLIGLSTSGRSPNVLAALKTARDMGLSTVLLTGRAGADFDGADFVLAVPSETTARIQEAHILMGHALCAEIEGRLGLA